MQKYQNTLTVVKVTEVDSDLIILLCGLIVNRKISVRKLYINDKNIKVHKVRVG